MKYKKILNDQIVLEAVREAGAELDESKKFIESYFNILKQKLIEGYEIRTPLGIMYITKRRLNTNVSDKTETHKLNYKIDKGFQNYLDSFLKSGS